MKKIFGLFEFASQGRLLPARTPVGEQPRQIGSAGDAIVVEVGGAGNAPETKHDRKILLLGVHHREVGWLAHLLPQVAAIGHATRAAIHW